MLATLLVIGVFGVIVAVMWPLWWLASNVRMASAPVPVRVRRTRVE